jgi:hypothetical protein
MIIFLFLLSHFVGQEVVFSFRHCKVNMGNTHTTTFSVNFLSRRCDRGARIRQMRETAVFSVANHALFTKKQCFS